MTIHILLSVYSLCGDWRTGLCSNLNSHIARPQWPLTNWCHPHTTVGKEYIFCGEWASTVQKLLHNPQKLLWLIVVQPVSCPGNTPDGCLRKQSRDLWYTGSPTVKQTHGMVPYTINSFTPKFLVWSCHRQEFVPQRFRFKYLGHNHGTKLGPGILLWYVSEIFVQKLPGWQRVVLGYPRDTKLCQWRFSLLHSLQNLGSDIIIY